MMSFICLIYLISGIINTEKVLIYPIELHSMSWEFPEEYFDFELNFYSNPISHVHVSFGSSGYILGVEREKYNITDINIKYDNIFPDQPTSGNITQGIFNASHTNQNVSLNVLYNRSYYSPLLGLSRKRKYDNSSIEKLYDLDFMSQIIKQGIIDKYYIYLTPFFDSEGNQRNDVSMELGRLPIYFYDKYEYSYTPLNDLYPTKWAVKLSHIIINSIKKENIYDIYADVIFTESYKRRNYLPEKLKTYFRTIFIDRLNCEYDYKFIVCPNSVKAKKFYLVFNGYAHFIPSSLLYKEKNETHLYSNFEFSSEIDYISIDS